MDKQTQKQKRSRKSAPKSRQGCITCKTRHVKCDEIRPFCKRCARAGRKCEGYSQVDDSPAQDNADAAASSSSCSSTTLARASSAADSITGSASNDANSNILFALGDPSSMPVRINSCDPQEMRFLEYFFIRTAPAISGFYDTNFYNRLLLQAAQYEPAIRHCMMAVGAMHEHFEFAVVPALENRRESVSSKEKPVFALQQYNKAISAISKQLSSGSGSIESVLMCCLLFFCLECLRGDTATAATHLKSGGSIIAFMTNRKQRSQSMEASLAANNSIGPLTDSQFIESNLAPIFERLNTHVSGAAKLTSSEFTDLMNSNLDYEGPFTNFESLDGARKSIMNVGSLIMRFTRSVASVKFEESISDDHKRAVAGLQRKLQQWDESMNALLEKHKHETGITRRAAVLQVQHRCFKVITVGALSPEQCANDCMTKDFEFGINLAERLLDKSESGIPAQDDEQDLSVFSLEEGVAPALFIFAIRCRIPDLRRKAVATIWKGPRRQGIWNAVLLAKIAERVIELEENFQPPTQWRAAVTTNRAPPTEPTYDAYVDPSLNNLPLTPESIESCGTPPQLDLDQSDRRSKDSLHSSREAPILPPENARIHNVDIKESIDGTPHKHAVSFFRKPNGLDKEWEIWTEQISI